MSEPRYVVTEEGIRVNHMDEETYLKFFEDLKTSGKIDAEEYFTLKYGDLREGEPKLVDCTMRVLLRIGLIKEVTE